MLEVKPTFSKSLANPQSQSRPCSERSQRFIRVWLSLRRQGCISPISVCKDDVKLQNLREAFPSQHMQISQIEAKQLAPI